MDIQTKIDDLARQRAVTHGNLKYTLQSVGMTGGHNAASLFRDIDAHIHAVVTHEVYRIVSSPEFFGLTVHGAAQYVEGEK